MLLTVEFQVQWSYDLEFKEGSQWWVSCLYSSKQMQFHRGSPPKDFLAILSATTRLRVFGLLFLHVSPLPRQVVPWKANLREERTSLLMYWKVWNVFKIWYLIISPNRLYFLISIDFWPIFQKPSLRQTLPILQIWHSKIDAGLGVRYLTFKPGSATFLTLSKSLTLHYTPPTRGGR